MNFQFQKQSLDNFLAILSLLYVKTHTHQPIGLVDRMFVNGPGDQSSIPSLVIPKTIKKKLKKKKKKVLDTTLLNIAL